LKAFQDRQILEFKQFFFPTITKKAFGNYVYMKASFQSTKELLRTSQKSANKTNRKIDE